MRPQVEISLGRWLNPNKRILAPDHTRFVYLLWMTLRLQPEGTLSTLSVVVSHLEFARGHTSKEEMYIPFESQDWPCPEPSRKLVDDVLCQAPLVQNNHVSVDFDNVP